MRRNEMVWYVCAKLVQMSALSIRRDGTRLLFLLLGIEKGDDDSTQVGASAVHTIQIETRCGADDDDDDVAGLSWTWVNRAMFGRSQCDSVSLFGAGRGAAVCCRPTSPTRPEGKLKRAAAGAGDLQPANQPASNQQAGRGTTGTREKEVKRERTRREAAVKRPPRSLLLG